MSVQAVMLGIKATSGGGDITTGLQGWWKFDDNTGTSAADSSGNTNTGTLSGATIPTWVAPGKIGVSMLNFGGTGYVSIANLIDPTAITMSAWVKASSFPNGYNTVISAVGGGGNGYHQVFIKSNGKLAVYVKGGSNVSYDGTGSTTLSTGVWYFICVTYDSTNGLVSTVNNATDATAGSAASLQSLGAGIPTSIGTDLGTAGRQWNGDLDDARIYNRALSALDITTLYAYT